MNKSEYRIYTIGGKELLFKENGLGTTSYNTMKLLKFADKNNQFYLLKFGNYSSQMFGIGDGFVEFLINEGVKTEAFELETLIIKEKFKDFEILEAELKDGYKLRMSASYLDDNFTAFLANDDKKQYESFNLSSNPRLTNLLTSNISLKAKGLENDDAFVAYHEAKTVEKSNNQLIQIIGILLGAVLVGYIVYTLF